MLWVVAFFLFSYSMLHAYFFLKVQLAFRLPPVALLPLAAFLLLMIFSVILIRILERHEHVLGARLLGMVGYPWIALIFWFCVFGLTLDAWNLLIHASAGIVPWITRLSLAARPAIYVVAAGMAIAAALSLVEANRIGVREISVQTPLIPKGSKPIRLVQISDMHLSIHRGPRLLRRTVELLNELKPDVVVCTGDLVDGDFGHIEPLAAPLAEIRPPLGKFAVMGNHEYYWDETKSLAFLKRAGFQMLREEYVTIAPAVVLAGVDDGAGRYTHQTCLDNEDNVLKAAPREAFTILLKHQPRVRAESVGRFDLQLSGHVHDGQIFPFQLVIRAMYPFLCGVHRLGPRSLLNVSRGVGTWGPPMRLGARPEICLITLEPAEK